MDRPDPPGGAGATGPRLLALECGVQHYAWGDSHTIPALVDADNPRGEPWAELWMGDHPDLPSAALIEEGSVPLDRLIAADPEGVLGAEVSREYGALPYLFKVLAAAEPLSVQVHPSAGSARAGFAREERAGVPRTAPDRSYRDPNPKPELVVALSDFHALRGFRPLEEIRAELEAQPELRGLAAGYTATGEGLAALYGHFMGLPQEEVDAVLSPLVDRLAREAEVRRPGTGDRAHWVLEADRAFSRDGHRDRGLLSVYLLNLVSLAPGQGMFLPAGVLHAYLRGASVELMGRSNNVLRGGLTAKHVDVPELLANVRFESEAPEILAGEPLGTGHEWVYRTPAREFELRRIELPAGGALECGPATGPEIVLPVEGDGVVARLGDRVLARRRGEPLLATSGAAYSIEAAGPVVAYRAGVPR